MDNKDPKLKRINFDYNNAETIFSEVIEIKIDNEFVILWLGQKKPDGKSVNATHKVYLTLPHFFRFVDVANNLANNVKSDIEKMQKEAQKGGEK